MCHDRLLHRSLPPLLTSYLPHFLLPSLPTSLTSYFPHLPLPSLPTSLTSHLLLPTSYFLLPTSYFQPVLHRLAGQPQMSALTLSTTMRGSPLAPPSHVVMSALLVRPDVQRGELRSDDARESWAWSDVASFVREDFGKVHSYFLLPTPYFRLPTSDFRLPTSDFRLPTSYFMRTSAPSTPSLHTTPCTLPYYPCLSPNPPLSPFTHWTVPCTPHLPPNLPHSPDRTLYYPPNLPAGTQRAFVYSPVPRRHIRDHLLGQDVMRSPCATGV